MKNMKIVSSFFVAFFLIFAIGCASTEKSASTGERIDDTVITTRVKAAILADDDVKFTEVNVETFKGVVQLSGFVSSQAEISRAVSIARGIPGVQSVKNDMRVK